MKYKQVIYLLTAAVSVPTYATSVDLDFSNHIESTNGSSGWAGSTYDGAVMHFLNVGTHDGKIIDAKVSSSVFGDATFVFHAPNYKEGSTQPSGDIGFLYQTNSAGSAGL
ncbi:LruC domain-containing protein, partial [Vibrio sp. 10N.261.45.A7]